MGVSSGVTKSVSGPPSRQHLHHACFLRPRAAAATTTRAFPGHNYKKNFINSKSRVTILSLLINCKSEDDRPQHITKENAVCTRVMLYIQTNIMDTYQRSSPPIYPKPSQAGQSVKDQPELCHYHHHYHHHHDTSAAAAATCLQPPPLTLSLTDSLARTHPSHACRRFHLTRVLLWLHPEPDREINYCHYCWFVLLVGEGEGEGVGSGGARMVCL